MSHSGVRSQKNPTFLPGLIALLGSGETAEAGRKTFELLLKKNAAPFKIAIMETPAGFQPNSTAVAESMADFLRKRFVEYHPKVEVIQARTRSGDYGTDSEKIIAPLTDANYIYMGAGSPGYAVRQLRNSLAWDAIQVNHRLGACLVLASAGVIAASAKALPVYEIFKVGEDLHWKDGLDLLGPYGIKAAFVSHWNSSVGGEELDTRFAFMGQDRFNELRALLPPDITIAGIDEHTGLIIDLTGKTCRVFGKGGVTVLRGKQTQTFKDKQKFALGNLGNYREIEPMRGIPAGIWQKVNEIKAGLAQSEPPTPPPEVLTLFEARNKARKKGEFARADALRAQILALDWRLEDEKEGSRLMPTE